MNPSANTSLSINRYHPNAGGVCDGDLVEKWSVPTFDAMGNVVVATQFERVAGSGADFNRIARRAQYDTLGRLRFNTAVTFGTWEYRYDDLGQMTVAVNPLGDTLLYEYDEIGRLISEGIAGNETPDAVYFYDAYPEPDGWHGNLLAPMAAHIGTYPDWTVTKGKLVAKWDRSGISVAAADMGIRGESWRMVFPDETRVYHSEGVSDYAGQLVYAQDDDRGVRTTASYYDDGTPMSSFESHLVNGSWVTNTVVEKSYSNILGQTERVEYGDGGHTVAWNGYDPVMHRSLATVVQQNITEPGRRTLMAFGYNYNPVGLLTGIADYRGRDTGGSVAPHPTDIHHSAVGYHFASLPGDMDLNMSAPASFNGVDYRNVTTSGWPIAAAPSDAVFTYDSRYQLVAEDRDYITNGGDDWIDPTDQTTKRARSLHWQFDTRGSMTSWTEEGDGDGIATENLGRALGGTIKNGWQLNHENGNESCMFALETSTERPLDCYIPDAVYFAMNIGDDGLAAGKGTCIWANYDSMGRMTTQTVRTGCTTCSYSGGANGATCTDTEATRTDYTYTWDARSHLIAAEKQCTGACEGTPHVLMTYQYDIGGNRTIREQSDINNGTIADIYQDVYLGGIERRHVQLQNLAQEAISIHAAEANIGFVNVDNTRELHHAAGLRLEWDNENSGDGIANNPPKIFLSFSNHLGSTSAVIDYDTGDLVEWNTNYAYGADESRWKNTNEKYEDNEDPYGFTGKEEDKAVGLHYFGARYYSSYLGRWLSPDPPVVHGGGLSNHYNYGGNSPYIFVDPDGNWIHAIIAAVVGGVVGAISGAIQAVRQGKGIGGVLLGALYGSWKGSSIAFAGAVGGPWAGAGAAACFASAETLARGGSVKDAFIQGNIAFGVSMVSWGIGKMVGGATQGITNSITSETGKAVAAHAIGYTASLGMAYGTAALMGGVNGENWDDILLDSTIGYVAGAIGGSIEAKKMQAGMGGSDDDSMEEFAQPKGTKGGNSKGRSGAPIYNKNQRVPKRYIKTGITVDNGQAGSLFLGSFNGNDNSAIAFKDAGHGKLTVYYDKTHKSDDFRWSRFLDVANSGHKVAIHNPSPMYTRKDLGKPWPSRDYRMDANGYTLAPQSMSSATDTKFSHNETINIYLGRAASTQTVAHELYGHAYIAIANYEAGNLIGAPGTQNGYGHSSPVFRAPNADGSWYEGGTLRGWMEKNGIW